MASTISDSTLSQFTTFGDLLKFLRRRAGLTQRELSIAVGYSTAQICRLEQNQRLPDLATLGARFVPELGLEAEPAVVRQLVDLASTVRREDAPAAGLPPFKGLLYFDETDTELFFGREALTAQLVDRLMSAAAQPGAPRFLAVVGASGSGKSSVVRAGLIPSLRWNTASAGWPVFVLTPTAHAPEALAASLLGEARLPTAQAALVDALMADACVLDRALSQQTQRAGAAHAMVVVDQFEELFTLCRSEAERRSLVDNLMTAAGCGVDAGGSGVGVVVIALRADFYAHCADYPSLRAALAQHQEYIGGMTAGELRRAIEEPAARGHWELEPGLVDVLLTDVGAGDARPPEPGALPLLSHALLETWQRRRGRTLTLSGYAASGGVRGAIAETAEAVFHDQLSPQQRAAARQIFLRLTEFGPDETVPDTRRRVGLAELVSQPADAPVVREVLTLLADARLITTEEETAEVAHEALIREWPTLRQWLNENREGLRLHRQLTEAGLEWDRTQRDEGLVYRGARLAQVLEWAAAQPAELNALERDFLGSSQALAEREATEREAQRERELEAARKLAEAETRRATDLGRAARLLRQRALSLAGALVVALLMAGAALYFGSESRQAALTAQAQQRLAFARELAAAAIANQGIDPERSLLLAQEAISATYTIDGNWTTEAEDALRQALLASRVELTLPDHPSGVGGLAFTPDGSRLATTAGDTLFVWDAASGQLLQTLTIGGDAGHNLIAFSPDGQSLATPGAFGSATVWDVATGTVLQTLSGHNGWLDSVAFSPDGARLATASQDRTAKVWDLATGEALVTLSGHIDDVVGVAFSPDGAQLGTISLDGTGRLWDAATGQVQHTLTGHAGWGQDIAFSPPCAAATANAAACVPRVVTASSDGTARIWDTATGAELLVLHGHAGPVFGVAFSPDGARLATAGFDGKVVVWDSLTGEEQLSLAGHTGPVVSIAFSPDGARLATGGMDGTARLWNVGASRELLTLDFPEHTAAALSPDGTRLLVGFDGGAVQVWDVSSALIGGAPATLVLNLDAHTGAVNDVAFSPDSKRLATASSDQTAKVWEAATGVELLSLPDHLTAVYRVAFSSDGAHLATAGDSTVRVWDVVTGEARLKLSLGLEAYALAFSPECALSVGTAANPCVPRLAVSSAAGTTAVLDLATGESLLTLQGHSDQVGSIAFSADGSRLATGSFDGTARVWDVVTGEEMISLTSHTGGVTEVAFNPACASPFISPVQPANPRAAERGPCQTGLATAGLDGTVRLWDAGSGLPRLDLVGHTEEVNGLAFSADGKRLLTHRQDGTVRFFVLEIEDLMALARHRSTRRLTTAECQQYLHQSRCAWDAEPTTTTSATGMPP